MKCFLGASLLLLELVFALVLQGLLAVTQAGAIPAFSRRYQTSCTSCHAPFPRLTERGRGFASNGFVIPRKEDERDYVSSDDDLLHLNGEFPIAVRLDAYGVYDDEGGTSNDYQTPWGVKLLSGGSLAQDIGYYFYFYLSERGEVAGLEDAYVHFNDVFGIPLDVMVGQFQVSDPMMKRELRLTYEDYRAYTFRVGDARTNLAYGRGIMLPLTIEKTRTDIVAITVNGSGLVEAGDDRKYDTESEKNAGLRLTQAIGNDTHVGVFGYWAIERQMGVNNELYYVGPDVGFSVGPVALTGQYLYRRDLNPTFMAAGDNVESNAVVAELLYTPNADRSRVYYTLLYNRIDSDLKETNYETGTVSMSYLLRRNMRLLAEYTRDLEHFDNRVVLGFASAF